MRLNLRLKLMLAFAGVTAVTSFTGLQAVLSLQNVSDQYEHAIGTLDVAKETAQAIDLGVERKLMGMRGYALYMRSDLLEEISAADKEILAQAAQFAAMPVDDADKEAVAQVLVINKEMDELITRAKAMVNGGKGQEAAVILSAQAPALHQRMVALTAPVVEKLDKQAEAAREQARNSARQVTTVGYIAAAGSFLVAIAVGFFMARNLARPVQQVATLARRLAIGDLRDADLHVKTGDETQQLAEAFTTMAGQLRGLIEQISTRAEAVLAASQELTENAGQSAQSAEQTAGTVGQVAQSTAEQAIAAAEMQRTLDELQQTIRQIAAGAQETAGQIQSSSELLGGIDTEVRGVAGSAAQVAVSAGESAATAREGSAVVTQSIAGMGRIKQAVGEASERISDLTRLSGQIGDISQAISEIADQTNLLALNAAIEAARAGEHGRGFAVVAEEVRRLAERSATFAREIGGLIDNIQHRTAGAATAMAAGRTEVESGARLAADAGQALERILATVESAARDAQAIAGATQGLQASLGQVISSFDAVAAVTEENTASTEQMAAGATQATAAVQQVATIATQNAAATQEVSATTEELTASAGAVASAAEKLHGIAVELQQQVSRFRV
jgi:methyl-accepting chemotaxis protein